jgi:5'-nucleotidase
MVATAMERRTFLAGMVAAGAAGAVPSLIAQSATPSAGRVTLLHTNDMHSHIEPFGPGNGQLSGQGGMARRAALVKQLRKDNANVLLLDAGDVFQGTPYFNQFKGRLEYKLMSMMGYDAATLGNHDFDNGVEGLLAAMEEATFPFVNCNFDMKGAPALAKRVQPWLVRDLPGIRVGITGVCLPFSGLVSPKNHAGVLWMDPVACLKPVVKHLREVEKVDLVVLLSHLGYDMKGEGLDDLTLPRLVPGLDAIIGGHSHTFLDQPTRIQQSSGETLIFQVGIGGAVLGRMDFAVKHGRLLASSGMALPLNTPVLA